METKFNFKSQVCTSVVQSRRLLELGLKKETADMCYSFDSVITHPFIPSGIFRCVMYTDVENKTTLPAWSLHRLIEMMPRYVQRGNIHYERTLFPESVCYYKELYKDCGDDLNSFDSPNLYDRLIHCIEWLIKEGYFPKEYLV